MSAVLAGEGRRDVVWSSACRTAKNRQACSSPAGRCPQRAPWRPRPRSIPRPTAAGRRARCGPRRATHAPPSADRAAPPPGRPEAAPDRRATCVRGGGPGTVDPGPMRRRGGAGVLVALARTEEVVQEIDRRRTGLRLLRHHGLGRLSRITFTVAASTRATASRACWRPSPGGLPRAGRRRPGRSAATVSRRCTGAEPAPAARPKRPARPAPGRPVTDLNEDIAQRLASEHGRPRSRLHRGLTVGIPALPSAG